MTNVVRHSGATRCEITVEGVPGGHVRLTVTDDGTGTGAFVTDPAEGIGGTGLKGLTERLAAAGGSLTAGPSPRGGFTVTAELPVDAADLASSSPGGYGAQGAVTAQLTSSVHEVALSKVFEPPSLAM